MVHDADPGWLLVTFNRHHYESGQPIAELWVATKASAWQ